MLRATIETIVAVIAGEQLIGDPACSVTGLAVDSREVSPSCIFAALPGERTDGHDHIPAALEAGARLILVSRQRAELDEVIVTAARRGVSVVRVDDVLKAVQDIASWHRSRLRCAVIGVTGSSGKTTTKDLLTAALAVDMRVVATSGNRNNELGVPLTVLAAGSDTDALVVEMGMRGLGQIERLCEIARPHFGLVTNVGTSHIEILGSQDAVAQAKGELVRSLPADGAAFLNGDDEFSLALADAALCPVTFYGVSARATVRAENIELDDASLASFDLVTNQGTVRVSLSVPGRHNVYNALAAAAVALRLAVPLERVAEGLGSASFSGMRMETVNTAGGVTVLNDAYNANPSSMAAAVDTLASMVSTGRRIAVLGDMAELGSLTELAHFHMGEQVARSGVEVLVTVGERARRIADGAKAEGMPETEVRPCGSVEEAIEVLDDLVAAGDVVLVKASRVMGLEAVAEGIVSPRAR